MRNKLISYQLFSDSDLKYELYLGHSETTKCADILVIKFIGEYETDSDAAFMHTISRAAIYETRPYGILLDLCGLQYEGGDMLDGVLSGLGENYNLLEEVTSNAEPLFKRVPVPQATLIGPCCKAAIHSLIADLESSLEEYEWLFEDFDMAWNYLEGEITRQRQDVD
jgi:hypothetical protein